MNRITISFAELLDRVLQMKEDNITTVTLAIEKPYELDGESYPACLFLTGSSPDDEFDIEFDEIESVE